MNQFQQSIPENNKPFVHHFHLTVCKKYKSYFDGRLGKLYDCQPEKPTDFDECDTKFLVSAKGFEVIIVLCI